MKLKKKSSLSITKETTDKSSVSIQVIKQKKATTPKLSLQTKTKTPDAVEEPVSDKEELFNETKVDAPVEKSTVANETNKDDNPEPVKSEAKPKEEPKPKQKQKQKLKPKAPKTPSSNAKSMFIPEVIKVSELAHLLKKENNEFIKTLMDLGVMVTINQSIDFETASIAASEYDIEPN